MNGDIPDIVAYSVGAFSDMNYSTITFTEKVTRIGKYAFGSLQNANLSECEIRLPDNLTEIADNAFRNVRFKFSDLTIPDGVTTIGANAFRSCDGLTSVTIPTSVVRIGPTAFESCKNLNSVTIGTRIDDSVLTVENLNTRYGIFNNCRISVIINRNVTGGLFGGSNITHIVINEGAKEIGKNMFSYCNELPDDFSLPCSITTIRNDAFNSCDGFDSLSITNRIETIEKSALFGCTLKTLIWENDRMDYTLSGLITDELIVATDRLSVRAGTYKKVTLTEAVTAIRADAFSGSTGILSIEIPNSITSIGSKAFSGCTGLTSIEIPKSVTRVGIDAFSGCKNLTFTGETSPDGYSLVLGGLLAAVVVPTRLDYSIPESVETIGEGIFKNLSFKSIIIGPNVKEIGKDAFYQCTGELTVQCNIPRMAFQNSFFTKAFIGNGVAEIGERAFMWCRYLTQVDLPPSVKKVGSQAFVNCGSLHTIVIPDGVEEIGDSAFMDSGLTSVTIGKNVAVIKSNAFQCSNMTEIYCKPITPPSITGQTFHFTGGKCTIYVPRQSKSKYVTTDYWETYADKIVGYDF